MDLLAAEVDGPRAVVLLSIGFLVPMFSVFVEARLARRLRSFTRDQSIRLDYVIIPVATAVVALLCIAASGVPLASFGFNSPQFPGWFTWTVLAFGLTMAWLVLGVLLGLEVRKRDLPMPARKLIPWSMVKPRATQGAVFPPVSEELVTRAILLALLTGIFGSVNGWVFVLASATVFGLIHRGRRNRIVAFVFGAGCAVILLQTQSIFMCMLLHVMVNLKDPLFALACGRSKVTQAFANANPSRNDRQNYAVRALAAHRYDSALTSVLTRPPYITNEALADGITSVARQVWTDGVQDESERRTRFETQVRVYAEEFPVATSVLLNAEPRSVTDGALRQLLDLMGKEVGDWRLEGEGTTTPLVALASCAGGSESHVDRVKPDNLSGEHRLLLVAEFLVLLAADPAVLKATFRDFSKSDDEFRSTACAVDVLARIYLDLGMDEDDPADAAATKMLSEEDLSTVGGSGWDALVNVTRDRLLKYQAFHGVPVGVVIDRIGRFSKDKTKGAVSRPERARTVVLAALENSADLDGPQNWGAEAGLSDAVVKCASELLFDLFVASEGLDANSAEVEERILALQDFRVWAPYMLISQARLRHPDWFLDWRPLAVQFGKPAGDITQWWADFHEYADLLSRRITKRTGQTKWEWLATWSVGRQAFSAGAANPEPATLKEAG